VKEGRLRVLTAAMELELAKRESTVTPVTRDPRVLLDLMMSALEP
jgi:hypothetical protein